MLTLSEKCNYNPKLGLDSQVSEKKRHSTIEGSAGNCDIDMEKIFEDTSLYMNKA